MWAVIGLALVGLTVASLVFVVVYRSRATRDASTSGRESNRDENSQRDDAADETNRGHRDVEEATTHDGRTAEKRNDGDENAATTGKTISFFGDSSLTTQTNKTDDKVAGGNDDDDDGLENEWLGGDPWSDNEIASSELSMHMDEDYQANRGGPDWLHHGRARRSVASLAERQRRRGSPKRYAFADDYYRLLPPAVPQLPSDSEGYVYG